MDLPKARLHGQGKVVVVLRPYKQVQWDYIAFSYNIFQSRNFRYMQKVYKVVKSDIDKESVSVGKYDRRRK